MSEVSNTVLFSHLLNETAIEVDKLDVQVAGETSLFFADKRVSLMDDFLDDLKLYIHACGVALKIGDAGKEIYARILSAEQAQVVSIVEAGKILEENIKQKREKKNVSWTGLPKAIFKSMEEGNVEATQDIFDRWYLLIGFISRDAIDAYDVESIATKNLRVIADQMFDFCKKREGYYVEHVFEVEGADTDGELNKAGEISRIPSIYEPDIDDLYIQYCDQYKTKPDLWADIIAADPVHNIPAIDKINALVGHDDLKKIANELSAVNDSGVIGLKKEFLNGSDSAMTQSGHHTALMGGPGAGKTTAARLLGQLHHEVGNLSKGHLVEVSAKDLIAGVIGGTAIKTNEKIDQARGGVLFIDEADKLYEKSERHNFASQAVKQLLLAMENEPDLVVVFAGYEKDVQKLIKSDPGIPRRLRHVINCPDFSVPQLMEVLDSQLEQRGQVITNEGRKLFEEIVKQNKESADPEFWGNGGFIRDYLSNVVSQQELRVSQSKVVLDFQKTGKRKGVTCVLRTITVADVRKASVPVPNFLKENGPTRPIGFRLSPQS